MKYVCLIYQDEVLLQKMPKEEMGKLSAEYKAFGEAIQKSGQLILRQGCNPLTPRPRCACEMERR